MRNNSLLLHQWKVQSVMVWLTCSVLWWTWCSASLVVLRGKLPYVSCPLVLVEAFVCTLLEREYFTRNFYFKIKKRKSSTCYCIVEWMRIYHFQRKGMPCSSSLFFSFSFPSDVIELSNNNTPARTSLMKRTEKSKFCLNHRPNIDLHLLPWEIHWRPVQRYDHRLQMLYLQRLLNDWLAEWVFLRETSCLLSEVFSSFI